MSDIFNFLDLTKWVNGFIDWFGSWYMSLATHTIIFLFSWLPDASEFPTLIKPQEFMDNHGIMTQFINGVSWCLPVQFFLGVITALSSFYFASFVYRLILRFLRAIK